MHLTKNISSLISDSLDTIVENIVNESLRKFPTIIHVILYGSYGRSEGAWYQKNGILCPYNDFDLIFVFKDKLPSSNSLGEFRKNLAGVTKVQWIDISFEKTEALLTKPNSIFYYDLKHGSKVIYGNPDILNSLPDFSASEIGLIEGEILFFTRLWTFSGSISSPMQLEDDDSRFFRYQMAKAILAVMDVILLINKSYDSSYVKRYEILNKNRFNDVRSTDYNLFEWALSEKLSPSNVVMSKDEVEQLYCLTADLYRYYMLNLLSAKYSKEFGVIRDFSSYYKKSLMVNLKRLAYPFIKKSFVFEKVYYANIVQMNVLSIILNEGDEDELLESSSKIMNKFGYNTSKELSSIKYAVADMRQHI